MDGGGGGGDFDSGKFKWFFHDKDEKFWFFLNKSRKVLKKMAKKIPSF